MTAALFAATLFLVPLVEPLQRLAYVYAPALVAVGIAMLPAVRGIDFDDPTELAPAPSGDLYVSDGYRNCCVHRFTSDGQLIQSWGRPGKSGPGEFHLSHSVVIGPDGRVYVGDRGNKRVQVFNLDGTYVTQVFVSRGTFPPSTLPGAAFGPDSIFIARVDRHAGPPASCGAGWRWVWTGTRFELIEGWIGPLCRVRQLLRSSLIAKRMPALPQTKIWRSIGAVSIGRHVAGGAGMCSTDNRSLTA